MDFNPDTWGTVADWVGGLGTAAAFAITAFVIGGDIKRRRRDQASRISYYVQIADPASLRDNPRDDYIYSVHNYSDNAIYSVFLYHPVNIEDRKMKSDVALLPGDEWTIRTGDWNHANMPCLAFRDADGNRWNKDKSGKLRAGWPAFGFRKQPTSK
ncbi:hypothetical protein [Pseudarthrobacter sp. fls2-241-R2A-168]|uniref:hypothetical protein n=1 Tax=Pseudarthrobacter sp. fls2-241-R2A-168 TaxID=3040304 RepID=UPI0025579325|nr:hypothetical protein [Pseudarthrobacter sp. fls2-241-R2A-168]